MDLVGTAYQAWADLNRPGALNSGDLYAEDADALPAAEGLPTARGADASSLEGAMRLLKVGKPSRYFALLRMDVDDLGMNPGSDCSQHVQAFMRSARKTVEDHDGFLVYGGGDDLLA